MIAKIGYTSSLVLPCMQSSTLETQSPALAIAQNHKNIFQNKWQLLQSNLHCPLQLVLWMKLPNAHIAKKVFPATLEALLNLSKQLMYEWNQIRAQQFDGMGRSQETARQKLCPNSETPDNAKKQGKDFLPLFRCQLINHFHIKIYVGAHWKHWQDLALWVLVLANTLSVEAIQIVNIQNVVHVLGECVSAMRHIGVLFPLKIVLEVTMSEEKNGRQHSSDVIAFLLGKEGTDFKGDASFHIPNIENTKGRSFRFKTRSLSSQYVITHSCGSPQTTRSSPTN